MKVMDSFHQRPVNMQINPFLIQFRGSKSLPTPKPTHINLLTQVKNPVSSLSNRDRNGVASTFLLSFSKSSSSEIPW